MGAATVTYVLGGFLVTFALNVPLNDQLAGVDLAAAGAAELATARADYEGTWNAWNAVRTVASTGALALVAAACLAPAPPARPVRPTP